MAKRNCGNPSRLTYTALGHQEEIQRNMGISADANRQGAARNQSTSMADHLTVTEIQQKIVKLEEMVAACKRNLEESSPIAARYENIDEDKMTQEELELWRNVKPQHTNSKTIMQRSVLELNELREVLRRKEETAERGSNKSSRASPLASEKTVRRKTASQSSVQSKSRSLDLEFEELLIEENTKFRNAKLQIEDEIEDLQLRSKKGKTAEESEALEDEIQKLQIKLRRLNRDHQLNNEDIEARQNVKKQMLALEEDEQDLGSDEDLDAVHKVQNWDGTPIINVPKLGYNYQEQMDLEATHPSPPVTQVPDKDAMIVQLLQNQLSFMQNPDLMREWKPKDLPTFYGKAEDWSIFRNEFQRTTPSGKINSSQNAIRLRKALTGSARDAVAGLLHDPNNCSVILDMLEERFGRNELVIESLIKKAESAKSPDSERPESFVQFGTAVLQLVETVKSLKEDGFLNDRSLLHKLVEKLPMFYSTDWMKWLSSRPTKTKNLVSFGEWIKENLSIMVRLSKPVVKDDSTDKKERGRSAKVNTATSENPKEEQHGECTFCGRDNHKLWQCFKFKKASLEDRLKSVKDKGLCFKCLGEGHLFKDCTSTALCSKKDCKGKHHTLIHTDGNAWKKRTKHSDGGEKKIPAENRGDKDGSVSKNAAANIGATQSSASKPLSIVRVRVKGPKGIRKVFALLDSGSDSTVIDGKLAAELGIVGVKTTHSCRGIGGITVANVEQIVDFEVAGSYKKASFYKLQKAVTMQGLGLAPYTQDAAAVKGKWNFLRRAKLESFVNAIPQLIIGEDNPYLTAHRDILEGKVDEPMAKRTVLGWVLAGRKVADANGGIINVMQLQDAERLDALLKESFSLDSYGVYPAANNGSIEDQRAMKILEATVKKVGSQWECGLLWRYDEVKFPSSRPEALGRLYSNERRMKLDPVFADMYHAKMEEYLQKGYIRELTMEEASLSSDKTLYIPHFGVFNVNKPGKLRLVFDAACKNGGVSLNTQLLVGPDLIRPLPAVLMNFRRHNIAINGDIEDMFHRVSLRKKDRDSQRFLFKNLKGKDSPIRTYVMNVLIFGACSSPSSAIYVKNRNAEEFREMYPEAARVIIEDFYCDDCLSGAQTIEKAIELRSQVSLINALGNFNVKKWLSNSKDVLVSIPEEDRAAGVKDFTSKDIIPTERVLGLWWNPDEDCFTFTANFKKVDPGLLEGRRPTKRELSRLLGSVFDPLGFIANFKVKGLILLQRVWRTGIDWDDDVTDEVYEDWKEWVDNLKQTVNVKVPRIYTYDIHLATSVQLHTLVDASEEACSSICYLRVKVGESCNLAFVCARTKVAPNSKHTIPRLELLAAVIGANLADTVVMELKIPITGRYFWSDSRTVLTWIKSESLRYKEFVANRISRIHQLSSTSEWKWVPTDLNVADDGTRFRKKAELSPDSRWLTGPDFLLLEPDHWPRDEKIEAVDENVLELRIQRVYTMKGSVDSIEASVSADKTCAQTGEGTVPLHRFSSYLRLLRAQAAVFAAVRHWIIRSKKVKVASSPWIRKEDGARRKKCYYSNISVKDLEKAEERLVRKVQQEAFEDDIVAISAGKLTKGSKVWRLSPFLNDGLLRLGSRLAEAQIPAAVKYPYILPSRHHFTELLIQHEHEVNGHQGQSTVLNNLRSKFWIIDGRAAVRRVVNQCRLCRLGKVQPLVPKMGSLPHYRLASGHHPFTFTGADLFGPLEVVVGRHREKRWVCVFTCMVTRAIHLEVVYGLSTDETMMALSRFIDQIGRPRHLYTDNGTNFVGAKKELQECFQGVDWAAIRQSGRFHEIEWHFTPPYSPHFGGAWERIVQSVKKVLKKQLHEKYPRDQTLLTMLKGAENIVNSRPLTYVSGDAEDPESLTPNHFLRGFADCGPTIPGSYDEADEVLRSQWRKSQFFLDQFWQRWTKEVLPEMARRQKWHADSETLSVGDLVFLVDENQPRNLWKRGVISATFPGKDGQVRVVEVTTCDGESKKKSTYKRGVEKVCPLGLRMGKSVP